METTTWLLDVDGVLNATGRPRWHAQPHAAHVAGDDDQMWRLRWAPQLLRRVRAITEAGTVRVVWCTTWCSVADRLERLWNLPPLERAWTDHLHGYAATEAKRAAARGVIADGGRLIWTDDDAFPYVGRLVDELTSTGRALLIKPDARFGLDPADMDQVEAFIADAPVPA